MANIIAHVVSNYNEILQSNKGKILILFFCLFEYLKINIYLD